MKDAVKTNNEFELSDIEGLGEELPKSEPTRIIFVDEEKGAPNYIFVGVNGKFYQIKRGVEVPVPQSVVNVLSDSVATCYVPTTDPVTNVITLIPQKRYITPFRVIK